MKDINLIPPKYFEKNISKKKRLTRTIAVVIIAALFLVGSAALFKIHRDMQKVKSNWDARSNSTTVYSQAGREYDQIRSLCKQRQDTATLLHKKGVDVPILMTHIQRNATSNLLISSMTVTESSNNRYIVTINGFVPTNIDINTFIYRLEKDVYFDAVKLNSAKSLEATEGGATVYNFIITLNVN